YVVCGVAVSPGVPAYSTRDLAARSRTRVDGVPGGGSGTRSPGRIPALMAAAVGRNTRTWRDGAATGSTRAAATAGSLATVAAGAAVCAGAGSGCEIIGLGAAGFSARTAGASRRTTCEGVGGTGSGS